MKRSTFFLALAFAVPTAAHAGPDPAVAVVDTGLQIRASDGAILHDLRLVTVEHQCAASRAQEGHRGFEVELCHRRDTAAGRILEIKWSMHDGKRTQRHEAWTVLAAGGSVEVGATRGKGDTLIVTMR